jgi:uncharacterized protein (TIGR03083 family)
MTMVLSKDETSVGLLAELDDFEALLRSLDATDRDAPTRCTGWSVGDVAAHLIGTMADITAGRFDGLGTPEVTEREVQERRDLSLKELADECAEVRGGMAGLLPVFDDAAWSAPAPGGYDGSLAEAAEALWYDTFLHADDIRSALGEPAELGPGLRAATSHVGYELTKRGWSGDVPDGGGTGMSFVLVATGRAPSDSYAEPLLNIYADA